MRIASLLLSASCLAVIFGSHAAAQTSAEGEATSSGTRDEAGPVEDETRNLETVIVTATRRNESINDVPIAVSAFNDDTLREKQLTTLSDLTAITPNIQISAFGDKANVNIRGIGNGNLSQAGGEPGVAISSDGVYLGQTVLALTSFLDVGQVEILRGPQGTLFGRNATGGAINLIPNKPTEDLSYGADMSFGLDPAMARTSGYVSGPLNSEGTVLGRLSVARNYNEGYTENLASSSPFRLDGLNNNAIRGQLQWQPTDDFSIRLLTEYQSINDSGPANFLLGNPADVPYVTPFGPAPIQGADPGNPEDREIRVTRGQRKIDYGTINLTANWNLGGGDLKALLSYNQTTQKSQFDGDGTEVDFTSSWFRGNAHQEFAEVVYNSDPSNAFTYTVGANYYHESLYQNVQVPHSQLADLFGITFTVFGAVDAEAYAAFGNAAYVAGPFKLFGGLRYSDDRKEVPQAVTNFPPATNAAEADSWSKLTYEAGLSYDVSPDVTGYAKYATGYKSGGFVLGTPNSAFDPETNQSYEVGLKGQYFGGALQANLSAFHMKYEDLQVNQILFLTVGVENAAQATINGVEIESVFRPTSELRVEANAAWLDATFDEFDTADAARPTGPGCTLDPATTLCIFDLSGNQLPNAPEWSGSLGVYYDMPIAAGTLTPGLRYSWKDDIYFSEFNIPISGQDAAGKLDLFLNYKSGDERWTAGLFALNLLDEQVRSNVTVVSSGLASMALAKYHPARQVGVSVGYHF